MFRATLAVFALLLTPAAASAAPTLEFLGEEILPTGLQFDGTEVGGLSSIAYDADLDRYYVISDDQSVIDPARYYTFTLDVADGTLDPGDVVVSDVTTLLDAAGLPFAAASFDPEGLALTKDDELVITSEGIASRLIPPWVRLFGLNGRQLEDLPVPLAFIPDAIPQTRGVRQNLGFESGHDRRAVLPHRLRGRARAGRPAARPRRAAAPRGCCATTSRPAGPTGSTSTGPTRSPSRRCRRRPSPSTGSSSSCRSTSTRFLSMERSFSVGAPDTGNTIKLFTPRACRRAERERPREPRRPARQHRAGARRRCSSTWTTSASRSTTSRA